MGQSRSATLVTAFLMKTRRMSLREALGHTKQRRSATYINPGFFQQLQEYEKELFGQLSPTVDLEEAQTRGWSC